MNKYLLHNKLSAIDNKADSLAAILTEAAKLLQSNSACYLYTISRNNNEPNNIFVTEIWKSKEDHQNSLSNSDVKSLISKAIPLLDGAPERISELEIISELSN